jgi:hypothetical protein
MHVFWYSKFLHACFLSTAMLIDIYFVGAHALAFTTIVSLSGVGGDIQQP